MTDYGTDLDWYDDLESSGLEVTGARLLAQEVYHRLSTPHGQLITDPDYGFDLRSELSQKSTAARRASLPARIRSELTKDDRIIDVRSSVVWSANNATITMRVVPSNRDSFDMVLDVTAAAVRIKAGD